MPSFSKGGAGEPLSSLAQSARQKLLRNARITLIVIGCLTLALNIGMFFMIPINLEQEARKAGLDPKNLPPHIQQLVFIDYAVAGLFAVLGVIFVVLGMLVYQYPVICTVTGLVLYLLGWLASAALNPLNLAAGLIIKIIIVVALFRATRAAFAYERERVAEVRD